MKRIILALYGIAALAGALFPVITEAGIQTIPSPNHNETLLRDRS